jgi:hypothetical protein
MLVATLPNTNLKDLNPLRPCAPAPLVRLVLGLVLLFAAAMKIYGIATEPLAGNNFWNNRWFVFALAEVELFFGLWLLSGLFHKSTLRLSLVWFAALFFVSVYQAISGEESCACFGQMTVNPWYTAIFDLIAIASLWLSVATEVPQRTFSTNPLRSTVFTILFLSLAVSAAVAIGENHLARLTEEGDIIGNGAVVTLEPETWVGKRLPLLRHIDICSELAKGQWHVILYHYNCALCRQVMARYEQIARQREQDEPRIAFVEVPEYNESGTVFARDESVCTFGHLKTDTKWYVTTPVLIELEQGLVVNCKTRSAFLAP